MSKKNVVLGLIAVGVLAGAAVLLGSDKGAKLRKKLKKKGKDVFDEYKNKATKYAESKV